MYPSKTLWLTRALHRIRAAADNILCILAFWVLVGTCSVVCIHVSDDTADKLQTYTMPKSYDHFHNILRLLSNLIFIQRFSTRLISILPFGFVHTLLRIFLIGLSSTNVSERCHIRIYQ